MNFISNLHLFYYLYNRLKIVIWLSHYNYLWPALNVAKNFPLIFCSYGYPIHFLDPNFSLIIVNFYIDSLTNYFNFFVIEVISLFISFVWYFVLFYETFKQKLVVTIQTQKATINQLRIYHLPNYIALQHYSWVTTFSIYSALIVATFQISSQSFLLMMGLFILNFKNFLDGIQEDWYFHCWIILMHYGWVIYVRKCVISIVSCYMRLESVI